MVTEEVSQSKNLSRTDGRDPYDKIYRPESGFRSYSKYWGRGEKFTIGSRGGSGPNTNGDSW